MIGSFWNLCRACPSMPVDKLHSEYRSTYRWHEYRSAAAGAGAGAGGGAGVVRQPAPAPQAALPAPRDMFPGATEPVMPRRKKYPGVAYKSNELFDPAAPETERLRATAAQALDRARSTERSDARPGAGRRSKSEGPRQTRWTDTVEAKATATGTGLGEVLANREPPETSTEYRNQFAWPRDGVDAGAPRKSISMGTLKLGRRKPGHVEVASEMEPLMTDESHATDQPAPKKFIEDYLRNGHQPAAPAARALKAKTQSVEKDEGCADRMLPAQEPPVPARDEAWYREVMDLRKRAGEYKCRGWGSELAPEHLAQLYDKQLELWHQVARRSSLAALALATTNHKALSAGERTGGDSRSPRKTRSLRAPPPTRPVDRSPHQIQRKKLQGHSFDETMTANEGRPADASRRSSPRKQATDTAGAGGRSPRRRPRSADPKPAEKPLVNGHGPPRKPNGLPLHSRVSRATKKTPTPAPTPPGPPPPPPPASGDKNATRRSRSVSKVGIKLDDDGISHRSASVAKDAWDDSPIVKSPPEPTRVKSPEQMNMRSPDPVNWTVPLDTGKTFTVTQNVKSDDSVKRPYDKSSSLCEERGETEGAHEEELAPVHHTSPVRARRGAGGARRAGAPGNRTPTTPTSLTPIDESEAPRATPARPVANGSHSAQPSPTDSFKSDVTAKYDSAGNGAGVSKKPTEATRKGTGAVDTTVVSENASSFTASEVLERARNTFDKFWGAKKEEDVV